MGKSCAWCEAVLHGSGTSAVRISHTICPGCLEELRSTLVRSGLQLAEPVPAEGRSAA